MSETLVSLQHGINHYHTTCEVWLGRKVGKRKWEAKESERRACQTGLTSYRSAFAGAIEFERPVLEHCTAQQRC